MAVDRLGVVLVLVLGHTRCAAIAATLDPMVSGEHDNAATKRIAVNIGQFGHEDVGNATRAHVVATARTLRRVVACRVAGGLYDVDTGRVDLLPTT
jgi:carbonic anhydrase